MVIDTHGIFECIVIAPLGRLVDCKTTSIVIPAHDGQLGVWYNHMPMICKLGLGIMKVTGLATQDDVVPVDTYLLIDGGFAMVTSNVVTVIAYDAISQHDINPEKIERIIERTQKKLPADVYTPQQRQHDLRKAAFMNELLEMQAVAKTEQVLLNKA